MRYESAWPVAAAAAPQLSIAQPLCVDLEGALVRTDLTAEAILLAAKQRPWMLPLLLWRAIWGWANFKRRLFQLALPDAELLPYRAETLDLLRREHAAGRSLILVSSADERMARAVADHLGIFDQVLASNGRVLCTGAARRHMIREYLGKRDFDYLGSTPAPRRETSVLRAMTKALRPHQWVKNLLVLLPLFLAHQVDQLAKAGTALVAMAAFCCCASAIYVLNDLLDLENDRRHSTKRRRPFAAGELSPRAGALLSPALCGLGLAAAARFVSWEFCGLLAVYVCLTTAYSVFLKKKLALDVLLLAGLYTYRMLAGAAAVDVELSQWLLAFSMFFFFSLALGKRYVELSRRKGDANETLPGRGYRSEDLSLLESLGPTSGYLAVLVLCLYLESKPVQELYAHPRLLWLACPVLLHWLTRFWLLAKRREIADDPVVFALKDKASLASIALTALVVLAARI